jgi:hypothetical protein
VGVKVVVTAIRFYDLRHTLEKPVRRMRRTMLAGTIACRRVRTRR